MAITKTIYALMKKGNSVLSPFNIKKFNIGQCPKNENMIIYMMVRLTFSKKLNADYNKSLLFLVAGSPDSALILLRRIK